MTVDMKCLLMREVTVHCGVVFPACLSCTIAMLSRQLILAPFAKAVGSLLSVSELLRALTLFLHYHLGMRQLKASGNLGFIDIAQRPQPGSICFPWQVSTTPAGLVVAVPARSQRVLTAALLWGRRTSF